MATLISVKSVCNSQIEKEKSSILKFKKDLDIDPMKALDWSSDFIHVVTKSDLCRIILSRIKENRTLDNIRRELFDIVLSPIKSESPESSNLLFRARQQAASELLQDFLF